MPEEIPALVRKMRDRVASTWYIRSYRAGYEEAMQDAANLLLRDPLHKALRALPDRIRSDIAALRDKAEEDDSVTPENVIKHLQAYLDTLPKET